MKKKLQVKGAVRRGRPSKYRPEYCGLVQEYMGQGYSLTAFAGSIGCGRGTVYEWEASIPAFYEAVNIARAKRVLKLEIDMLSSINATVVKARIRALKNACPAEWRMKIAREIPRRVNVSRVTEQDATGIYREMTAMLNFRTP